MKITIAREKAEKNANSTEKKYDVYEQGKELHAINVRSNRNNRYHPNLQPKKTLHKKMLVLNQLETKMRALLVSAVENMAI